MWTTNTSKYPYNVDIISEGIFDIGSDCFPCQWRELTGHFWMFSGIFLCNPNEWVILEAVIHVAYLCHSPFGPFWQPKNFPRAAPTIVVVLSFLFPFNLSIFKSREWSTSIPIKASSLPKRADSCPIWRTFRKNAFGRGLGIKWTVHFGPSTSSR